MKTKLKTNCSIVRIVRLFDCGRVVRCAIMAALCAVGLAAFAVEPVKYLDWDGANKKLTNAVCAADSASPADLTSIVLSPGRRGIVKRTVFTPSGVASATFPPFSQSSTGRPVFANATTSLTAFVVEIIRFEQRCSMGSGFQFAL